MAKKQPDRLQAIRDLLNLENQKDKDYLRCMEMYLRALEKKHVAYSAAPFIGYSKTYIQEGNLDKAIELLFGIVGNFAYNKGGITKKMGGNASKTSSALSYLDDGSFARIVDILSPYMGMSKADNPEEKFTVEETKEKPQKSED